MYFYGLLRCGRGCPAATHFLCFAKESKQRKATPGSSALAGCPSQYRDDRPVRKTRTRRDLCKRLGSWLVLKHANRTAPVVPALLGDSHGDPKVKGKIKSNVKFKFSREQRQIQIRSRAMSNLNSEMMLSHKRARRTPPAASPSPAKAGAQVAFNNYLSPANQGSDRFKSGESI